MKKWLIIEGLLAMVAMLFFVFVASAQEIDYVPDYTISTVSVSAELKDDGSIVVDKKIKLNNETKAFFWQEDLQSNNLEVWQDKSMLKKSEYTLTKENEKYAIKTNVENASKIWEIKYQADNIKLEKETGTYKLNLSIVLEPATTISDLEVKISLPRPVLSQDIKQTVYAIHGVGGYQSYLSDQNTLYFSGKNLSNLAIYTVATKLPVSIFNLPFFERILIFVKAEALNIWMLVGAVLPVLAIFYGFFLKYRKRRFSRLVPSAYLDKPPDDLSPAGVGVLLREKISQREITASLLDITSRGFIDIVKKRDEYVLGKRAGRGTLKPFEEFLYDKLFVDQGVRKIKRSEAELKERAHQQLYSPKISRFYQGVYLEVQKRGYFAINPSKINLKYRIIGIAMFLLAVLVAIAAAQFSSDRPYAIFGSAGLMLAALSVMKYGNLVQNITPTGRLAMLNWRSFGRFLADKEPLNFVTAESEIYEKYLPYAVALGKEIEWTNRFAEGGFFAPSWYVTDGVVTLESFAGSLFYITGILSQILYGLREPGL